jgi:decaprenylphospho-beta-D-erythro-pentofuranosid-2-ulose 2-reductase
MQVLIIGATSAIAAEVAKLYAAQGDSLYLMARSPQRLSQLAEALGSAVVGSESGDFNQYEKNHERIARAVESLGRLDVVVIAHGSLGDQLRSEREWGEAEDLLATNLLSTLSLLIPLGNVVESQGHGHIAVMSSVAGDRGRPRNYTYASAKAGVNVYLQGLKSRLWATGGRTHILKLGPVHTPMTEDHPKNPLFAQPERVAQGIVRAIARDKAEVYLPGFWRPIMFAVRLMPEPIFQRVKFLSGR